MSHEMTQSDQMYSVRQAPWHMGMGTNVLILDTDPETRMDRMTAAGHNWFVIEGNIYDDEYQQIEGWNQLRRSDTREVLNICADSYEVVQNIVGHELFEALTHGAKLSDGTGGTCRGGKVCYLTAQVDEDYWVKGDPSPHFPRIGTIWAHDKSFGIQAFNNTVRIVCMNTLRLAELQSKRAGRNFTFKHTANILERIDEAKMVISGARDETKLLIEQCNELGLIPVSEWQKEQFVLDFIPMPPIRLISDRVKKNIEEARAKVSSLFYSDTIPPEHRNTGYGLLQVGIEYLDHIRGYRDSDTYLGRTLLKEEPLKKRLVPLIKEITR